LNTSYTSPVATSRIWDQVFGQGGADLAQEASRLVEECEAEALAPLPRGEAPSWRLARPLPRGEAPSWRLDRHLPRLEAPGPAARRPHPRLHSLGGDEGPLVLAQHGHAQHLPFPRRPLTDATAEGVQNLHVLLGHLPLPGHPGTRAGPDGRILPLRVWFG
jgi:hypothetical protein